MIGAVVQTGGPIRHASVISIEHRFKRGEGGSKLSNYYIARACKVRRKREFRGLAGVCLAFGVDDGCTVDFIVYAAREIEICRCLV